MAEEKKSKGGKVGKTEAKGARGGGNVTFDVIEARPQSLGGKTRYAKHWEEKALPELMKKFGYTSVMQAPRFVKIVLNMGVGDATVDVKNMDIAVNELAQIAGQRPSVRKAKKAISNFKLRQGLPIGCMVTLRGARMFEFYDRLINVAVPRIRDFRGLSPRSFDGRGNYSAGFTEQIIFPEINIEKVGKVRGMDVTIVTTAKTDEEGRELLRLMNMPFRQR
ncbi:MAG: 50S ribosomal protein L5 [Candidatus Eisenbacteria bacterium]|uniref:Large ribosomal subunit protein uL5 n=1 Tax=Eiseniibacteriota bacterium TaxID=2212470 RepID=A0A933SE70_UNCEI|nr:50S ribosomal protein L5 [Candidatus Eisenbacteria bacterium]